MIVFSCSSCNQKLSVRDELAGKKIKCPKCSGVATAPLPAELSESRVTTSLPQKAPRAGTETTSVEPAREKKHPAPVAGARSGKKRAYWLVAASLFLSLIGVGVVVAVYFYISRPETLDRKPILVASMGQESITSSAISPDGTWVATGGSDKTVRLWDVATGREIHTIGGYGDFVGCVAISADSKYLFSSGKGIGRLHDLAKGTEIHILKGHRENIHTACFSRDGKWLVTGSGEPGGGGGILPDHTARLWDVATGKQVRVFRKVGPVNYVAITSDSKYVATGSFYGGSAVLRNLDSGELIRIIASHSAGIFSIAFSPDDKLLITGSADRTAALWDITTGKQIRSFQHNEPVRAVALLKDGKSLTTASGRNYTTAIRHLDVESGKDLMPVRKPDGYSHISAIVYTDNGKIMYASDIVRLCDADTGNEVRTFGKPGLINTGVAFSGDGKRLVTSFDKKHWSWNLATGQREAVFLSKERCDNVAVSADGASVWAGTSMFESATGKEIQKLPHAQCSALSRDNQILISGSEDWTATVWKLPRVQEVRILQGEFGRRRDIREKNMSDVRAITAVSVTADGGLTALARHDGGEVDLYEPLTGKLQRTIRVQKGQIRAAILSSDGKLLLTDSIAHILWEPGGQLFDGWESVVQLWDVGTGSSVPTFPNITKKIKNRRHLASIGPSAVSSDFKMLVTPRDDNSICLWDVETGKEVRVFNGHTNQISCVALTGDAKRVLSSGHDGTRVWDAETGKELCRILCFVHGGWAVVDAEGRYDTDTPDDLDGLHWAIDNETFPLGKFKKQYHDPGLLAKYMGLNAEPLRPLPLVSPADPGSKPPPPSEKAPAEKEPVDVAFKDPRPKARPKPITPDVRTAWTNAGAETFWNSFSPSHELGDNRRHVALHEGQPGDVLILEFRSLEKWRPGDFAKLPSPPKPFWVQFNQAEIRDGVLQDLGRHEGLVGIRFMGAKRVIETLPELNAIKQLRWLSLEGSPVTNDHIKGLTTNQKLEWLDLQGTATSDAGIQHLGDLKALRYLNLSGTKVTDAGLKVLSGLPDLEELNLGRTQIGDAGLKELSGMKHLKRLRLSTTQVTDAGMRELAKLGNIEELELSGAKVTDAGLKDLAGLKQLTVLRLNSTQVTDVGLKELAQLTRLRSLDVSDTRVTFRGIEELQDELPKTYIQFRLN